MMQKLTTNKLFYKEWPYKITVDIKNICYLRYKDLTEVQKICDSVNINDRIVAYKFRFDPRQVGDFLHKFIPFAHLDLKIRYEQNTMNIYVKTQDLYVTLIKKCRRYITHVYEPTNKEELTVLETNSQLVICDKFPLNKYQYKVFLREMPIDIRHSIIDWLEKYDAEQIRIPNSTKKLLNGIRRHWYGDAYFYVRNKQMLLLATLAAQGYIRRTEEFVLRSSINT